MGPGAWSPRLPWDPVESIPVSTNGTRRVTDVELPRSLDEDPQSFSSRSMDERLASLKQTIQTWDWRSAPMTSAPLTVEPLPPPPPVEDVGAPTAMHPASSSLTEVPESTVTTPPGDPRAPQIAAGTPSGVVDLRSPHVGGAAPTPRAPESVRAPDDAAMAFGPEPKLEPDRPVRRLWSHPWVKAGVLGLSALLAVLVIIWGIRQFAANSNSSQQSATNTTTPTASIAHKGPPPISAAQLTQFEGYARELQKANETATKGFISAGTNATQAHVAAVISSYHSALNLYYFQLHFIHWPASMETATVIEYAQLQTLMSFLQSFSSADPTAAGPNALAAWLSQLHNRTGTTQAADNQIRQDLGLPATSSFP